MIYLQLFLTFLKIGAVSFGGGYGMISLIREECLNYGWLTEEQLLNFIAVSESTPGPIAVNMATFVGSSQAGILGSALATLGVILPSFIIILAIAALIKNLLKYAGVKSALEGVRPAVTGLIIATAVTTALSVFWGIGAVKDSPVFDAKALIIFCLISAAAIVYRFLRKKDFSPIILIIFSGLLGIAFYL